LKQNIKLNVNGETHDVFVDPPWSLLKVLRDQLNLTGVKRGCDELGQCGSCTVLLDGKAVYSCLILAVEAEGKNIVTIEGLAEKGKLHPIQEAFLEHGAFQCGFCTSGMILTAKALIDENPKPSEEDIREAIVGNLCRCGGYAKIVKAIMAASSKLEGGTK